MTFDTSGLIEKKNRAGTRYYVGKDGEMTARDCNKCGETKKTKSFSKSSSGFYGRASTCKDCKRIVDRDYRIKNTKRIREVQREWEKRNADHVRRKGIEYRRVNAEKLKEYFRDHYEKNKDEILTKNRKYYEKNKEKILVNQKHYYENNRCHYRELSRKYREENKEKIAESKRQYQQLNREKISSYQRKYREQNKERIAEVARNYQQENKERISEYMRNYQQENREKFHRHQQRRRARKVLLPDDLTTEQQLDIIDYFNASCALTEDEVDIHFDHVIPLVVGHGGTIFENMIPLRADLNLSKSDRNIFDWFNNNRERFGLEQRKFDELIEYLAGINDMTTEEYEDYVRWCHDNPRTIDEINAEEDDDGASA